MQPSIRVKICGLLRAEDVSGALAAGATYLGFVFFPPSPRAVTPSEAACLAAGVPPGICKVGLVVDAGDEELDTILSTAPLDMLQLHGAESPERVAAVKARYGLPVMKAVGIAGPGDLAALEVHARVADQILVDAKPPAGADRPGGNAATFDWGLIAARRWPVPWMLAGGMTVENVATALRRTGARQVDVSSGVESAPGRKDAALMKTFVAAACSVG